MTTFLKPNPSTPNAWDLWVDDEPFLTEESYGVACAVEAALHGLTDGTTEADEVADAIWRRIEEPEPHGATAPTTP